MAQRMSRCRRRRGRNVQGIWWHQTTATRQVKAVRENYIEERQANQQRMLQRSNKWMRNAAARMAAENVIAGVARYVRYVQGRRNCYMRRGTAGREGPKCGNRGAGGSMWRRQRVSLRKLKGIGGVANCAVVGTMQRGRMQVGKNVCAQYVCARSQCA